MINGGVGEQQLNNIFAALDLPTISTSTLKEREREVGAAFETVAAKSCEQAKEEEKENAPESGIGASADGGWQRRSTGTSYNSLSGHATMIGQTTGKVLAYGVCSKTCRICEAAERRNEVPKQHNCQRNFYGSAKAMEPYLIVNMLQELKDEGKEVKNLVMDDDTNTVARAKKKDLEFVKRGDKNHIFKNLSKKLYKIRTDKKLQGIWPCEVIEYFVTNVKTAARQGIGNPELIKQRLKSIVNHAHGDHGGCDSSWCKATSLEDPSTYVHSNLPNGRPLSNRQVREAIDSVMEEYTSTSWCQKLSDMGTTNACESLNGMIARKAPKSLDFSGSERLKYGVASAVSQKNLGHQYVMEVNKELSLSPGALTAKRFKALDRKKEKETERKQSKQFKQRTKQLKKERTQKTVRNAVIEGASYLSELGAPGSSEVAPERLPEKIECPSATMTSSADHPTVIFDVETTGGGIHDSVVQIAAHAVGSSSSFSTYLLPQRQFTKRATDVTGLSFHNGRLLKDGAPVNAVSQQDGIKSFLEWLPQQSVLVAHKADFDARMITLSVQQTGLEALYNQKVAGFADSLTAFKDLFPGQDSYSQVSLAANLAHISYAAHDATADVNALHQLLTRTEMLSKVHHYTISKEFVLHRLLQLQNQKLHLPSYSDLIERKVLPKCTTTRLAESGVNKQHLQLAFEREGADGVTMLLREHLGRATHCRKLCEEFTTTV